MTSSVRGFYAAYQAMHESEAKVVKSAAKIAEGDLRSLPESLANLRSARAEHQVQAVTARSLDQNVGTMLDMFA